MNAGAYGGEIKDIIVSADVLDRSGRLISLSRDELELGYRTSCIAANDYIVVSAVFRLQKGDTDTIKALIKELAVKRRTKQPLNILVQEVHLNVLRLTTALSYRRCRTVSVSWRSNGFRETFWFCC